MQKNLFYRSHVRPAFSIFIGLINLLYSTACSSADYAFEKNEPANKRQLAQLVNPFLATPQTDASSQANGFPGAQVPFGVVALSPDCGDSNTNSGYSEGRIKGFSHLHVSGTGGGPKYGNILLSPIVGPIDPANYGSYNRSLEKAKPGYYSVHLDDYDIGVELTASQHVGLHRYQFPESEEAHILIDIFHHLNREKAAPYGEAQRFVRGRIELIDSQTLEGYGIYRGGWNSGDDYTVYFCVKLNTAARDFGIWRGTHGRPITLLPRVKAAQAGLQQRLGAYLSFKTTNEQIIQAKVGISFVNLERARSYVAPQTGEVTGWDFEKIRSLATAEWESHLSKISISLAGTPQAQQDKLAQELSYFYSALYRAHLMPSDRTGENPSQPNSKAAYFDNFYCIWDTYRTLHPLLTLTQPKRQARMIQSLINIAEQDGYLPDGRSGNSNGRTQGGSNADIVIADGFVKNIDTDSGIVIDWIRALTAMKKNAFEPPKNPEREGRGGLENYLRLGYVSSEYPRSCTRTVEYSYCDFAIAQLLSGLIEKGSLQDKTHLSMRDDFVNRFQNWKNLWDPNAVYESNTDSAMKFQGFIWARDATGRWMQPFDSHLAGSWGEYFYEDNTWSYSLSMPHDMQNVIELVGGKEALAERLDFFFSQTVDLKQNTNYKNPWFRIGNEPDFFLPFAYAWAGQPNKIATRVRDILRKDFGALSQDKRIPGNDDAGAVSSWYLFSASGFYPVAGTDLYLLFPPLFPRVTYHLEHGDFTILVKNPELLYPLSEPAYIQSIDLESHGQTKKLKRAWIRHSEFTKGATLRITLGRTPSSWGTEVEHTPPSGLELLTFGR